MTEDNKILPLIEGQKMSPLDADRFAQYLGDVSLNDHELEEKALKWLAEEYGLKYQNLEKIEIDSTLLRQFPARILLKENLLPLAEANGKVIIATSQLFRREGLQQLTALTGQQFKLVLATEIQLEKEIKRILGVGADTLDELRSDHLQIVDEEPEEGDLDQAAEDASIIRFVNQILSDAIGRRATDIHFEPYEDEFRIRYRVDGVLQNVPVPEDLKHYQAAIVSRVKILSHLDIAEKRLPQDGRIKLKLDGATVDVRVSVIPMLLGEALVLRLLRQSSSSLKLEHISMAPKEESRMRELLELPHGIILVTGPTGSGKTTTLYAALSEINDHRRKIITIEDPVEYHIKGINQIQVSEKTGLTFAKGLRSILRHDPDVVLIGEIRDAETAKIAVQASLTGHLVFSTLHTNDAPGAINRLVDMGVPEYLVASSLEAVLAQRLVRVLCENCKEVDHSKSTAQLKKLLKLSDEQMLYRASTEGCETCFQTGYHGRQAVFELLNVDEDFRQLILGNKSASELKQLSLEKGLISLAEDGRRLLRTGQTSLDELLRVTRDEGLSESLRDVNVK